MEVRLDLAHPGNLTDGAGNRCGFVCPTDVSVEQDDVVLHHDMDVGKVEPLLDRAEHGPDAVGERVVIDVRIRTESEQPVHEPAPPSAHTSQLVAGESNNPDNDDHDRQHLEESSARRWLIHVEMVPRRRTVGEESFASVRLFQSPLY